MTTEKNQLEQLMDTAFNDHSKMDGFYAGLLSSEIFVLTPKEEIVEGPAVLTEGQPVQIANFTMQDGTPFIPAFTSLEELQRSIDTEYNYMSMKGWDLFSLTLGTDFVINPASEQGLHLKAANIEAILQHFKANPLTVEAETSVLIGLPAEDPVAMKESLARVLEREDRVQSAHYCLMVNQKSGDHSLVIGIEFKPGQEYLDFFNTAGAAAAPHVPKGYLLDFIVIDRNEPEGLAGAILKDGAAFYTAGA